MKLNEDDLYRTSTQFRNWQFTPAQLALQRQKTNVQACERVRAAWARQRAQRGALQDTASGTDSDRNGGVDSGANTPIPLPVDREVHCLTEAEEQRLVDVFCGRAIELGQHLQLPTEVIATGVQYLKRFYLFNSPMTYEPQAISRTAMFLAIKTEAFHSSMVLDKYQQAFPKVTREQILAPEYILMQALRFNIEVRHPFRALKGGHMELVELAEGKAEVLPGAGKTNKQLQAEMLALPRKVGGPSVRLTPRELEKRIMDAYGATSPVLKNAAILTDAYFLYTPSQIWLAAHLLADEPLTLFYLSTKIPTSSPVYPKIMATLRACSALLSSHHSYGSDADKAARQAKEQSETSALIKKLKQCRDPDKLDLVKLNQAQKRDAVEGEQLEESKAKRRKVAREGYQKEADDFWGPELKKEEPNGKPALKEEDPFA